MEGEDTITYADLEQLVGDNESLGSANIPCFVGNKQIYQANSKTCWRTSILLSHITMKKYVKMRVAGRNIMFLAHQCGDTLPNIFFGQSCSVDRDH